MDPDTDYIGAPAKELADVAMARRMSNASESDFTGHSDNDENPTKPEKSQSIDESSEISETSETFLTGWGYEPPTSGANKRQSLVSM